MKPSALALQENRLHDLRYKDNKYIEFHPPETRVHVSEFIDAVLRLHLRIKIWGRCRRHSARERMGF